MNEQEKQLILSKAKEFFRETIAENHIKNTLKLKKLTKFQVNPFLINYLANFLTGNDDPASIAKALIYPRVLGTSITTSFGTNIQYFCSQVLTGFASAIPGLDIEFNDYIDNKKKYCQIKAGPNTINKDDVKTVAGHFKAIKNLARTNQLDIGLNDLVVGVLYGTQEQLSLHYKNINQTYPVFVGQDFWHRLTGSENFYFELIEAFGEVAIETDGKEMLNEVINELAKEIEKDWVK